MKTSLLLSLLLILFSQSGLMAADFELMAEELTSEQENFAQEAAQKFVDNVFAMEISHAKDIGRRALWHVIGCKSIDDIILEIKQRLADQEQYSATIIGAFDKLSDDEITELVQCSTALNGIVASGFTTFVSLLFGSIFSGLSSCPTEGRHCTKESAPGLLITSYCFLGISVASAISTGCFYAYKKYDRQKKRSWLSNDDEQNAIRSRVREHIFDICDDRLKEHIEKMLQKLQDAKNDSDDPSCC